MAKTGPKTLSVSLTASDRAAITYLPLLPVEGNKLDIVLTTEIFKNVVMSSEDLIAAKYVGSQDRKSWRFDEEFRKDFEFTLPQIQFVKTCLKAADEKSLYNRAYVFVEEAFDNAK
jgi:hypothetical protein